MAAHVEGQFVEVYFTPQNLGGGVYVGVVVQRSCDQNEFRDGSDGGTAAGWS